MKIKTIKGQGAFESIIALVVLALLASVLIPMVMEAIKKSGFV